MDDLMGVIGSLVESGELRPLPSEDSTLSYEVGQRDKFLTIIKWSENKEMTTTYDAVVISNMLAKFLIQQAYNQHSKHPTFGVLAVLFNS